MKKLFKHLASLVSVSFGHHAVAAIPAESPTPATLDLDKVKVNKLNASVSNFLASHRSHSSHSSHASHRSSSGGGYQSRPAPTPYSAPTPAPSPPAPKPAPARPSDPLGQPSRPQGSYPPQGNSPLADKLKNAQSRKNIIMRMQLALQFEGLYHGPIDGIMGPQTRSAVLAYKRLKGIPGDTVLDAETLNALGIQGF